MTLYRCAAYLENSEVQKSGVSTNQKQTAIGPLFKDSISLIKHRRALWTLRNKHNHKIWTEVTNTSSSSDANPRGGITLHGVFSFFMPCKMPQLTELHTATPQMKEDVEGLVHSCHERTCVWNIKSMTCKNRESIWESGMKGSITRDETNKILKRNKSISLSPCIHNVLKLQFNLDAKKHWVGLRIVFEIGWD